MANTSTNAETSNNKKTPPPTVCSGCGGTFPSRNQLFRHLKVTNGACLKPEDQDEFAKYVKTTLKGQKVIILYGYIPCPPIIRNGQDAAQILLQVMEDFQQTTTNENDPSKINRSYGSSSRSIEALIQDEGTGAITEVMTVRLHPISPEITLNQWLDAIQSKLDQYPWRNDSILTYNTTDTTTTTTTSTTISTTGNPSPIRILGRQEMAFSKFNAEMDVTHRRVEYILPLMFLKESSTAISYIAETMPAFDENHKRSIRRTKGPASRPDDPTRDYLHGLKKTMQRLTTHIVALDREDKNLVMEKEFHVKKRNNRRRRPATKKNKLNPNDRENEIESDDGIIAENGDAEQDQEEHNDEEEVDKEKGKRKALGRQAVLRRKRYHNFTPKVMAHNYLAYRRLDRMYHRATLRVSTETDKTETAIPMLVLSMTGDMFLTGQVARLVGLFIALANHLIDADFVDCVFDEDYPHLVPTPPAPILGMVAGEAYYMTWEGKTKSILSPRVCSRYDSGWNQPSTLLRIKDWQKVVHEQIANRWLEGGIDATGRLEVEKEWTEQVLKPWVEKAKVQLEDYRLWLKTRSVKESIATVSNPPLADASSNMKATTNHETSENDASSPPSIIPPLETVDPSVPEIFEKVLYYLREANANGTWPSTTLKRQLVMISTPESGDGDGASSTTERTPSCKSNLSIAHLKAKNNKQKRSSAYQYAEGCGGASGSFSVGAFPGGPSKQPKSNWLFPALTKAAFELERKLRPHREPSSTIAINRNAQFRPHTDSGAGAGQSTSLIVALGTYSGGELVVEGEKHDIRYKAIEFNGWEQRHWTMPFSGERYSLVWFTPKGCEGLRGIDLDWSQNPLTESPEEIIGEEELGIEIL